jgi:hypothetical protein
MYLSVPVESVKVTRKEWPHEFQLLSAPIPCKHLLSSISLTRGWLEICNSLKCSPSFPLVHSHSFFNALACTQCSKMGFGFPVTLQKCSRSHLHPSAHTCNYHSLHIGGSFLPCGPHKSCRTPFESAFEYCWSDSPVGCFLQCHIVSWCDATANQPTGPHLYAPRCPTMSACSRAFPIISTDHFHLDIDILQLVREVELDMLV